MEGFARKEVKKKTQERKITMDTQSYQKYQDVFGEEYENFVNGSIEKVNNYVEEKIRLLRSKIQKKIRNKNLTIPETESLQNYIQSQTLVMNEMTEKFRTWLIRTIIFAFSVLAMGYAAKITAEETQKAETLRKGINMLYDQANKKSIDSTTGMILHSIAGDKQLPKEWRNFLLQENGGSIAKVLLKQRYNITPRDWRKISDGRDSSDFFKELLKKEYSEKERVGNIPDMESKLNFIALLKLNEKYGKPILKYGHDEDDLRRAFYTSEENTINLPANTGKFKLSDYLAELSHSKQWMQPETYDTWFDKDVAKAESIATARHTTYDDAQNTMYNDSTTVEFEAHKIIEPQLIQEFKETKEQIRQAIMKQ